MKLQNGTALSGNWFSHQEWTDCSILFCVSWHCEHGAAWMTIVLRGQNSCRAVKGVWCQHHLRRNCFWNLTKSLGFEKQVSKINVKSLSVVDQRYCKSSSDIQFFPRLECSIDDYSDLKRGKELEWVELGHIPGSNLILVINVWLMESKLTWAVFLLGIPTVWRGTSRTLASSVYWN